MQMEQFETIPLYHSGKGGRDRGPYHSVCGDTQRDAEDTQPLVHNDYWTRRARVVRISKAITWALTGLLLTAVFVILVVRTSTGQFIEPTFPGLTSAQTQEVKKRLPPGVQITVPPTTGRPIRKQSAPGANQTAGPHLALDPRVNYSQYLKPAYHLAPDTGWMNDPNGMFQLLGNGSDGPGPLHVFYQWNPAGPYWAAPWWGHVVSWDLVRWKRLPAALKPDQWYDSDGVFSGSATVLPDGTPLMLYTAVMDFSRYGFFYQTQASAVPTNLSDPLLLNWTKLEVQGMDIPPGGTHAQFRDPVTAWRVSDNAVGGLFNQMNITPATNTSTVRADDGPTGSGGDAVWMTAVGALDDCVGAAALYVCPDNQLRNWKYAGTLYSQLAQNMSQYGACLPPPGARDGPEPDYLAVPVGARGFGGNCDQFGRDCRMWECPDFFTVDPGVDVFKYSDQSRGRYPWAADYYVLGESRLLNYTRAVAQDGQDAFAGTVGGAQYYARLLDYGVVYASKSFKLVDGRRVWLGWVYEDSVGCTEVCGDGTPFIKQVQRWQGAQTLLRQISYAQDSRTLLFTPVAETQLLRVLPPVLDTQLTLGTQGSSTQQAGQELVNATLLPGRDPAQPQGQGPRSGTQGRQLEVQLSFSLQLDPGAESPGPVGGHWPVVLGLRVITGNGTYTDILLNGTATLKPLTSPLGPIPRGAPALNLTSLTVTVDRSHSGGMTSPVAQGGEVPLPPEGVPAQAVNLTVYVDHSVWEVYALDGRAVITTRVYALPTTTSSGGATVGAGLATEDELGSWGYEALAQWPAGTVAARVMVYDMGTCWLD